jgi:hypothetical protein
MASASCVWAYGSTNHTMHDVSHELVALHPPGMLLVLVCYILRSAWHEWIMDLGLDPAALHSLDDETREKVRLRLPSIRSQGVRDMLCEGLVEIGVFP